MSQRVLVVDDDEYARKPIVRVCKQLEWEVDEATDGNQGLKAIKSGPHDLFLFDLEMPGLSGLDLMRILPEYEEQPAVIIITGFPQVETAVDAFKHGVMEYLSKPIRSRELRKLMLQTLQRRERRLRSLEAVRQREKTVQNIQEENERFRMMMELGYDSVFLLDIKTGRILDCNATACEHFGCPRDKLLDRSLLDVYTLPLANTWHELADRIRNAESLLAEGVQRTDGEEICPVEISLSTGSLPTGESILAVVRDITDRKRLEHEVLEISSREQGRIAQDLHDGLCQHLKSIEYLLAVEAQKIERGAQPEVSQLDDIAKLVNQATSQAYSIAKGLHPISLSDHSFVAAINGMVENLTNIYQVTFRIVNDGPIAFKSIDVATHLYRITQEAVSNAIKHGRAKNIRIEMNRQKERFVLVVEDDGIGLPGSEPSDGSQGMGLKIMEYRSRTIGGLLSIERGMNEGTVVTCSLPYSPEYIEGA